MGLCGILTLAHALLFAHERGWELNLFETDSGEWNGREGIIQFPGFSINLCPKTTGYGVLATDWLGQGGELSQGSASHQGIVPTPPS